MKRRVLLDTGPLVAFLNRADTYHDWARERWAEIEAPLLSCEAVMAETCHLLRHLAGGSRAALELINRQVIVLPFRLEEELQTVATLMARYANVPMSLADACLVRMTEQYAGSSILTLDRDFTVYRKHGRKVIPTLMP